MTTFCFWCLYRLISPCFQHRPSCVMSTEIFRDDSILALGRRVRTVERTATSSPCWTRCSSALSGSWASSTPYSASTSSARIPTPSAPSGTVHPQNVRIQNVRFQNVWFQNVRFQNVRLTKCQVYETPGFKTSGFKTSSF